MGEPISVIGSNKDIGFYDGYYNGIFIEIGLD